MRVRLALACRWKHRLREGGVDDRGVGREAGDARATRTLTRQERVKTAGSNPGAIDETLTAQPEDIDGLFRIADCKYIYNLDAISSLSGVGTYKVFVNIDGTNIETSPGIFGLRYDGPGTASGKKPRPSGSSSVPPGSPAPGAAALAAAVRSPSPGDEVARRTIEAHVPWRNTRPHHD